MAAISPSSGRGSGPGLRDEPEEADDRGDRRRDDPGELSGRLRHRGDQVGGGKGVRSEGVARQGRVRRLRGRRPDGADPRGVTLHAFRVGVAPELAVGQAERVERVVASRRQLGGPKQSAPGPRRVSPTSVPVCPGPGAPTRNPGRARRPSDHTAGPPPLPRPIRGIGPVRPAARRLAPGPRPGSGSGCRRRSGRWRAGHRPDSPRRRAGEGQFAEARVHLQDLLERGRGLLGVLVVVEGDAAERQAEHDAVGQAEEAVGQAEHLGEIVAGQLHPGQPPQREDVVGPPARISS